VRFEEGDGGFAELVEGCAVAEGFAAGYWEMLGLFGRGNGGMGSYRMCKA
jgi:hypothetical protein